MSHVPRRGEVWQVDFGITQKVRPALVISIPFSDADRALIGVIPHTTAVRGSQFEVHIAAPFPRVHSCPGHSSGPTEVFPATPWHSHTRAASASGANPAALGGIRSR